jgi:hypothetical protein
MRSRLAGRGGLRGFNILSINFFFDRNGIDGWIVEKYEWTKSLSDVKSPMKLSSGSLKLSSSSGSRFKERRNRTESRKKTAWELSSLSWVAFTGDKEVFSTLDTDTESSLKRYTHSLPYLRNATSIF